MKLISVKYFFVLLLTTLIIQSCSEDIDVVETENLAPTANARGGGNNNRGPNNDDDNDGGFGQNNGGRQGGQQSLQNTRVIEDWIKTFLEIERYAGGMRPNATARALAYIHLAGYETFIPTDDNLVSNSTLLPGLPNISSPTGQINYQIALNQVYSMTLDHFLINVPQEHDTKISQLYHATNDRLARDEDSEVILASQNWGTTVANAIISYAQTDAAGEAQILNPQPTSYIPPTGPGYWTFSAEPERALFPYWGNVRTFVIAPNQTSTIAPLEYSTDPNSPYYRQMVEVYQANNSARENDDEQLWIAEFWSDDVEGITFSPPARQFAIAEQLIDQYNMSASEALLMNVKLGFALNDAAVSTWHYKYQYMVMRPSVFIQHHIDPAYQTNLYRLIPWPNPTFPGYPSGHSSFASAASGVFINFLGNQTNFSDRSHAGREEFRSKPRSFRSFEQMARENAYSRIPLGVHIEMDCAEGLRLGYEISDAVNDYNLTNR